jgi:hypothetical protein
MQTLAAINYEVKIVVKSCPLGHVHFEPIAASEKSTSLRCAKRKLVPSIEACLSFVRVNADPANEFSQTYFTPAKSEYDKSVLTRDELLNRVPEK